MFRMQYYRFYFKHFFFYFYWTHIGNHLRYCYHLICDVITFKYKTVSSVICYIVGLKTKAIRFVVIVILPTVRSSFNNKYYKHYCWNLWNKYSLFEWQFFFTLLFYVVFNGAFKLIPWHPKTSVRLTKWLFQMHVSEREPTTTVRRARVNRVDFYTRRLGPPTSIQNGDDLLNDNIRRLKTVEKKTNIQQGLSIRLNDVPFNKKYSPPIVLLNTSTNFHVKQYFTNILRHTTSQ